uniref:Transmembrane protein n=1 Tax=Globisporangium ultimum (strain ATCC 200006 / CBS 805.95 / DAOM BR144) TaxID=431595 RepID=K3WB89_GLOUD
MRDSLRDSLLSQTRPQRRALTASSNENDSRQQPPQRGVLRSFFAFVVFVWSVVVVAVTNAARTVTTRRPKSMRVSVKNEDVADLESGSAVVTATTEPSSDRQSKDSRLMSLDFFCESGSFRAPSSMSARCGDKESEVEVKGKCNPVRASKSLPVAAKVKAAADTDAREERHLTTTEMMDNLQDEIELLAIISKYTTTASEPDTPMLSDKGETPILGDMEEVEIRLSPSFVGHHGGLEQQRISVPMRKSSGLPKQHRTSAMVGRYDIDAASAILILGGAEGSTIRSSFVDNHGEVKQQPADIPMYRGDMQQKIVTSTQDASIVSRSEDVEAVSAFPLLGGGAEKSDIRANLSFADKHDDVVPEPADVTMQHEQQKMIASKQELPFVSCGEKIDASLAFPTFSIGKEEAQIRSSASSFVRESESVLTLEPSKASMQREQRQPKVVVAKQVVPFPVQGEDFDPSSPNPIFDGAEKAQIRSNASLAGRHGGIVRELANFLMQRQQKKKQDFLTKKEAEFATRSKDLDEASTISMLGGGAEEAKIQSTPSFAGRCGDMEPTSIPMLEPISASMRHEQQQPMAVKKQGFPFAVQGNNLDAASTIPILGDGEKTQVRSFAGRFGGVVRELAGAVMQRQQSKRQDMSTKQEAPSVAHGSASMFPILGDVNEVDVRSDPLLVGKRSDAEQEIANAQMEREQLKQETPFVSRGEEVDTASTLSTFSGDVEEKQIRLRPSFAGHRGGDALVLISNPMLKPTGVPIQREELPKIVKRQEVPFVARGEDEDEVSTFPKEVMARSSPSFVSHNDSTIRELASVLMQREQKQQKTLVMKQGSSFVVRDGVDTVLTIPMLDVSMEEKEIRCSGSIQRQQKQHEKTAVNELKHSFNIRGEDEDEMSTFPILEGAHIQSSQSSFGRGGIAAHEPASVPVLELVSAPMRREQQQQEEEITVSELGNSFPMRGEDVDVKSKIPILGGEEKAQTGSTAPFTGGRGGFVRKLANALMQREQMKQNTSATTQRALFMAEGENVDAAPAFPIPGRVEEVTIRPSLSFVEKRDTFVQEPTSASMQREELQPKAVLTKQQSPFGIQGEDVNVASTIPIVGGVAEAAIRPSPPFVVYRGGIVRELATVFLQREQKQQQNNVVKKQEAPLLITQEASALPILYGVEELTVRSSPPSMNHRGNVVQDTATVPMLESAGAQMQQEQQKPKAVVKKQTASPFMPGGEDVDAASTFPILGDVEKVEIRPSPSLVGSCGSVVNEPTSAPVLGPDVVSVQRGKQPKALKKEDTLSLTRCEDSDTAMALPFLGGAEEVDIQSSTVASHHGDVAREPIDAPMQREKQQTMTVTTQDIQLAVGDEDANVVTTSPILGDGERSQIRLSALLTGRGGVVRELANALMQRQQQTVVRKCETSLVSRGEDVGTASEISILGGSAEEAKVRMSSSFVHKLRDVAQEPVSVPIMKPRGVPAQREQEQEFSFVGSGEDIGVAVTFPVLNGAVNEMEIQSPFVGKLDGIVQKPASVPMLELVSASTRREEQQPKAAVTKRKDSIVARCEYVEEVLSFSILGDAGEVKVTSRSSSAGRIVQEPASVPILESSGVLTQLEQKQQQKSAETRQQPSFVARGDSANEASAFPILDDAADEIVILSIPFVGSGRDAVLESLSAPILESHALSMQREKQPNMLEKQGIPFVARGKKRDKEPAFPFVSAEVDTLESQSKPSFAGRRANSVHEQANSPMQDDEQKAVKKQEAPFVARGKDADAASMHSTIGGVLPSSAPMLEPADVAVQREQQKKAMRQEAAFVTEGDDEDNSLVAFDNIQVVDTSNKIEDDGDEEMKPLSPMQNGEAEGRVSAELQNHELAETRGTLQSSSDEEMKPAAPMQTAEGNDGGEEMKLAASMQNVEVKPRKFTIEDRAKIKEALDLFEMKQMQEAAEAKAEAEMDVAVCCPVQ